MRGRQRTPTFLYGPSCSGKTVALRQILEELPTAVYVSCDGSEISAAILLERIVIALHDDCPWIFLVGHIRSTRTESLARVAETGGAYVLIDHAERSNIDQVRAVADELASFSISTLVATNRIPSPFGVEEWIPVPGLGHDEIVPWLAASAVAPPYGHSEILRAAKGSPAEFWRLLHGRSNEVPLGAKPLDVVRLASILRLTNGYGDVELFHAAFDLDEDERTFIEGTPYILPQGLWHYPNDTLVEAAGTQIDEHLVRRAVEYLGQEIKDNRSIVEPAAQIVNIAVRYPEPLVELDVCLAGAISRLSSKGYSELISVAVKQMLGQMESFPVTLSCILEWAADRGRSTVFNTLLAKAAHHGSDPRFFVIRARIAWWMGDYASCIDLAQAVLEDQQVDDQTREAALLESGIGHFFLGSWNEAISAFSVLGSAQTASLRTRHWARFMKATANGLRGNDVVASIRQLGRSGEFLLDWGDFAGAAICFGNAAEIACKTGALDEAESFLSKGTRLAESHGVQINAVEHERVSLHVQLRRHGASNPSVEAAFQRLKSKLPLLDSRMEAMQVRNTLATASVLRGTLSEAASMIAENQALVLGNKEYEIYWRWNKTLLAARLGHLEGAKAEFSRGLALAVASENKLALAQFLDDVQLLDKASRTLLEFTKGSLVP